MRYLAMAMYAIAVGTAASVPSPAGAQSPPAALPTAPGAGEKAAIGGYTGARASLEGDHGSPLEPYLFLSILAGGGIIAVGAAILTDRRLRGSTNPRALF